MIGVLLSVLLLSVQQAAAFQPTRSAEESVSAGVQAVLSVVRKYSGDESSQARQQYLDEVSDVLEPVIGYAVIARRVMGDAYNDATREQKIRFLETFKRSMVNTYAGGIYAFGAYEVRVLPSQDDKKDTLRNTRVYLEVVSPEGQTYPLVQSVYYSQSSDDWKMQNAIFNGINLGVTFRTQFEQIYDEADNDLDKAITEWARITEEAYNSTNFRNQ
ncbi:ABC-type transport system involved in resistance to organic solvents, auxiliary component [Reinekea sp. MED297]|uniref:ABC-type transport system involved in resistance to organic solvents, auxiliary component n=1 Tax=Reinekea blandensis MED297 TaxID=314283 RepID=A4BC84_9GAMM|nr:ABC-type transport system involved in resistance to organic solvents, auxiliary component [Reinekea sp. MED297] [Reinekea blandensis MED297]